VLPDGTSALVLAAHSGQEAVASLLLDKGADPNTAVSGYTALHAAVLRSEMGLVTSLLARGANPNAPITKGMPLRRTSQDFELPMGLVGATPYALAAKFLEVEIMRVLAAGGADPQITMRDGTTPLMAAAGMGAPGKASRRGLSELDGGRIENESRVAEAVTAVLALGGDVNAANRAGDTALHSAASQGYDSVVQLLIDHGAQVNVKNRRGQTPLGVLTGGRKGRADGATAFVNTYNESSHPSTVALLRKLGAVE
jgi:ankyrin repeat protein